MGFSIGNEIGIWKYGYEAIKLMNCFLVDRYYDNNNYFGLIYTIMNKDNNIEITSLDFDYINGLP